MYFIVNLKNVPQNISYKMGIQFKSVYKPVVQ